VDVAAGVDVAAAGADEDPPVVEELEDPELPQPATARQTRMSAPLAYRRIGLEVSLFIVCFLFCRFRDRPIRVRFAVRSRANGRSLTHHRE
jgi:hypothetical protein